MVKMSVVQVSEQPAVGQMNGSMNVRIHRGCDEIGGSCVEVEYRGSRLILDIGRPLSAGRDEFIPLPQVPGLETGDPSIAAILLSHGHQDHWGLIDQVHRSIPVYIGKRAADVLRAADFWGAGIDLREHGHFDDRVPMSIGEFTVTPYLVDHSGFDAYAFVIEAGGQRLMYSGDFRGHGRKSSVFERLIADPPGDIDALLLEGTHVGQASAGHGLASEAQVEKSLAELARSTNGAVVTLSSAQNIDRLVTCYRAALRSGRELVMDLYTAEVAAATGLATIPKTGADWPRVKVFLPQRQRMRVVTSGEFARTDRVRPYRIYPEQTKVDPSRYLFVGAYQGEVHRMLRDEILTSDGCVVWSLWDGYLDDRSGQLLVEHLDAAEVPLVKLHTSGHASPTDLQRFVDGIKPRTVVPIHTENPHAYSGMLATPVAMQPNGSWWPVDAM